MRNIKKIKLQLYKMSMKVSDKHSQNAGQSCLVLYQNFLCIVKQRNPQVDYFTAFFISVINVQIMRSRLTTNNPFKIWHDLSKMGRSKCAISASIIVIGQLGYFLLLKAITFYFIMLVYTETTFIETRPEQNERNKSCANFQTKAYI